MFLAIWLDNNRHSGSTILIINRVHSKHKEHCLIYLYVIPLGICGLGWKSKPNSYKTTKKWGLLLLNNCILQLVFPFDLHAKPGVTHRSLQIKLWKLRARLSKKLIHLLQSRKQCDKDFPWAKINLKSNKFLIRNHSTDLKVCKIWVHFQKYLFLDIISDIICPIQIVSS